MQFFELSQILSELEQTSSRLTMTEILAEGFKKLSSDEIVVASYLLQGRLVPAYESLEFYLSVKMVLRAIARLIANKPDLLKHNIQFGTQAKQQTANQTGLFADKIASEDSSYMQLIEKEYKKIGDVGSLVALVLSHQKPSQKLSVREVYDNLRALALKSGEGSQERKLEALADLLSSVDALSARYICRIIVGKLRLGFATMTMLDALSWAITGTKSDTAALEMAYQKKADVGELAKLYLSLQDLSPAARQKKLETEYRVTIGIPVVPALCQRLKSTAAVVEKMGRVIVEPKYDGLRIQIHVSKHTLKAFTRNLEEVSAMFPELQELRSILKVESCILDGEVVGKDKKTGKLLAFQETSTRRRKHGVSDQAVTVPAVFFIFDVLAVDGKGLIDQKLRERKDVLSNLFKKNELFFTTTGIVSDDPKELRNYHQQQLAQQLEGVVFKQIDSPYESGRKGWSWVKLKEAEGTAGKLSDTLDCIVMGYYSGRGKRSEFGIGAILVGIINPDNQSDIVTIAKIGTGISDEQLRDIKQRCDDLAVNTQPDRYVVHKDLQPDVWTRPELIVEIAADEITRSPKHTAKVALRFPRLVQIREDKGVEQATTLTEVQQL